MIRLRRRLSHEEFSLEGHPYIPLCNLLKISGWCDSGAAAKLVIDDGRVRVVNDAVETR